MNIVEFAKFKKMVGGGSGGGGGGEDTVAPGLYQAGAIARYNKQGAKALDGMMITPWAELLSNGIIHVDDGVVYSSLNKTNWENESNDYLAGDLIMPNDGSIIKVGDEINESYEHRIAFEGCNKLTGITIPDSVISICFEAFYECAELTTVTFGEYSHLETILNFAFYQCPKLESIDIPDFTKEIGSQAFNGCVSLTRVTLPESLTRISSGAFCACKSLTSIVIPNSVKNNIWQDVFGVCTNLVSATIPVSMTQFHYGLFRDCPKLTTFNYEGTTSQWKAITKDDGWNDNSGEYIAYCVDGAVAKDGTVIENGGGGLSEEEKSKIADEMLNEALGGEY